MLVYGTPGCLRNWHLPYSDLFLKLAFLFILIVKTTVNFVKTGLDIWTAQKQGISWPSTASGRLYCKSTCSLWAVLFTLASTVLRTRTRSLLEQCSSTFLVQRTTSPHLSHTIWLNRMQTKIFLEDTSNVAQCGSKKKYEKKKLKTRSNAA